MDARQLPELLLPWYEKNKRDLPWRRDREPYHVWLSEIMLQQTRVEAVRGYYLRFLAALPTIADLAVCDDDMLHKLWEGLGYYSRVRNLKKAARALMEAYGGIFPENEEEIRGLPGIGDYTAGAIASICFEQKEPAVDGNVLRVMARLWQYREPVTTPAFRRAVRERLREVYPAGRCGEFTQALMELGATVCLPNGVPACGRCPLAALCQSREGELFREIPVREEKKPRKEERKTVFLLHCGEKWAVRKRGDQGLLAGLWEFPNVPGFLGAQEAVSQAEAWGCRPRELLKSVEKIHIFTHIRWEMTGYYIACDEEAPGFLWVTETQLDREISLPTAFRQFRE